MKDYLDLKSYIISYLEDRKIRYTKLDKHDRAIDLLVNENKELIQTIDKAIEYIEARHIKAQVELTDREKHLLDILKGEDNE